MTTEQIPYTAKCSGTDKEHDWREWVTLREPNFNVAYASHRTCKTCGVIEYDDWTETRACGGVLRHYRRTS